MKVSGFTIVRNALKFDYPVRESILSVLPVVDEMIVCIGQSEDDTEAYIRSIGSDKIKIVPSVWDDRLREGGRVLAEETNKAFRAISPDSTWGFYIQADEVLHEKYHQTVRESMLRYQEDKQVEGLLFNYTHFYGSYKYVGNSRKWYRNEIRIVRNDANIRSYRDAQGFRKNDAKLKVKAIDANIYHYGWVKPPEAQQAKQEHFNKLWHDDQWMEKNIAKAAEYDYQQIDSLLTFSGTHPACMEERLKRYNWNFEFDPNKAKLSLKDKALIWLEKSTGWRPGEYKNYEVL